MSIITDYFVTNYITLMILSAVAVLMIVNRNIKIPASQLIALSITLLIAVTIMDMVSEQSEIAGNSQFLITLHTFSETLKYILRPAIIMTELLIIQTDKKFRPLYIIPAVINGMIYLTALFGSDIAFSIDSSNHWQGGTFLRYSVYVTQLIYVLLLLVHTVKFFRRKNTIGSLIVLLIFAQSLSVALLEYLDHSGFVDPITALGILEYYIYLSVVYQQEISAEVSRKEIDLMKSNLIVLRNQIQPHFIKNTLGIIRYLTKRDSKAAVKCIDQFSKYLKAHMDAIHSEDMIPFERELENVKDYIALVQIDYTRKMEVNYELGSTDFLIPPLSLEPIVENAIDHGISREGGTITLRTFTENGNNVIVVKDSGNAKSDPQEYTSVHNGVGLENTRKRIGIQCGGTLDINITGNGAEVTITLPEKRYK